MEIKIPEYFWFSNCIAPAGKKGHPYSGSAGADAGSGSMKTATLSFTVVLKEQEDETAVFCAECWREQPWKQGVGKKKTDFASAEFPDSEESIKEIEKWLNGKFAEIENQ